MTTRPMPSSLEIAQGAVLCPVDELAVPGELPEDSANTPSLELLERSLSSVRRCRWGSCFRELLFVVHAWALSSGGGLVTR